MADNRREPLLAKRIPLEAIELGRAYVIHARNGGVGVAMREEGGRIGYALHREKFGNHFLFVEWDWAEDPQLGTVIPLALIETKPTKDEELLAWLTEQEAAHKSEIDAAWRVVLGKELYDGD